MPTAAVKEVEALAAHVSDICEVVAKVPDVGSVKEVVFVKVNVALKAPVVVTAPAVVNAPPNERAKADHTGVVELPDNKGRLAVAVPDKIAPVVALL